MVVLDRPNPLGLCWKEEDTSRWHRVEGNLLDLKYQSFVGWYAIPMRYLSSPLSSLYPFTDQLNTLTRHGLTLGELGNLFIERDGLRRVRYSVVRVQGLKRSEPLRRLMKRGYALSFPFASPNMPSWNSAFFFPAFVVLETTQMSEGRGTTIPFQLIGAPYLDAHACVEYLKRIQKRNESTPYNSFNGLTFGVHHFRPTFNKHAGSICKGVRFMPTFHLGKEQQPQLQVKEEKEKEKEKAGPSQQTQKTSEKEDMNVFALGMHFLHFVMQRHAREFRWREVKDGYEYNFTDPALLLVLGNEKWWQHFNTVRDSHLQEADEERRRDEERMEEERLESLLQAADLEAQRFADEVQKHFLYY